mgnify:FL=1
MTSQIGLTILCAADSVLEGPGQNDLGNAGPLKPY